MNYDKLSRREIKVCADKALGPFEWWRLNLQVCPLA